MTAAEPGLRPLVFVAMPFGTKLDPTGRVSIDFDDVYHRAIRPAVDGLDIEIIRADEERTGGFIHLPMYERLLLAEVVVADLTLANPNVFYELGIRHAARPHTTITLFAEVSQLPFDVAPLRSLPYRLEDGRLTDGEAARLRQEVGQAVGRALEADTPDSPLFQLIANYPGIDLPHDVTETFRDRARLQDDLHRRLLELGRQADKAKARQEVGEIERKLMGRASAETELLVDLVLTYRDLEGYDDMVRCIERLPPRVREHATIQEQLAFALNRRNGPGDRQRAQEVLEAVLHRHGPSAETYGLLGRVHKDRYQAALDGGDADAAEVHLDEAIDAYRSGFEADPRDYYPGVNAVTLLLRKGTPEAAEDAQRLAPIVGYAVARRGGLASSDYWDVATVLELACIAGDRATANRAAVKATTLGARDWMYDTTIKNLRLIRQVRGDQPWLADVEARLAAARRDAAGAG